MNVERSTLEQVRERIAALREQTREKTTAKTFDFEKRLADIRTQEEERRAQRKRDKQAANAKASANDVDAEVQDAMGFGGFGSTKR